MGKAKLLLTCSLCDLICKRGVILPCCGLSSKACRNCAVKRITETRQCWACGESDVTPSELINSLELREACKQYEDTGKLEDHLVQKLKSVDERMIEKLKNKHLRKVKLETESERDDITDLDDKKLLQKLLQTENLKRKKVEDEEKMTEMRKRAAKNICEGMLMKEKEASERRSQEIERREKIWMQATINLSKLSRKKGNNERLAIKAKRSGISGGIEGNTWMEGGELKPWMVEYEGINKFKNFPKTMDVRGYGHRDGLGYSWGRGIRKRVL